MDTIDLVGPKRRNRSCLILIIIIVIIALAGSAVLYLYYNGLVKPWNFQTNWKKSLQATNYQLDLTTNDQTIKIFKIEDKLSYQSPLVPDKISYYDLDALKTYTYDAKEKNYYFQDVNPTLNLKEFIDPYYGFNVNEAKSAGWDRVGETKVRKFTTTDMAGKTVRFWVNPVNGLPLKIESQEGLELRQYTRIGEIKPAEVTLPDDARKTEAPKN